MLEDCDAVPNNSLEPTVLAGSTNLSSMAKLCFAHVKRILCSAVQRLNSGVKPWSCYAAAAILSILYTLRPTTYCSVTSEMMGSVTLSEAQPNGQVKPKGLNTPTGREIPRLRPYGLRSE